MVPPTRVVFAGIDDGSRSAHHSPRSPFRLGDHGDTCPRRLARAFFQDWRVRVRPARSAAPLVILQQPVQRCAPLIGERKSPVGARDKTLFEQGGDAPGVGPFGVRLDVEEHRAFCGREAVRRYGLRTHV
jgi:hypothetical protein